MAKRFKLKLSPFQICRSKSVSVIATPSIYRPSRFNPKAFGVTYPKLPDPPPSTPDSSSVKHHAWRRKASRSLAQHLADCSIESPDFVPRERNKWPARPHRLMRSVSFSDDSLESFSSVIVAEKQKGNSVTEEEEETELETETLLFSSTSFSCDSSHDFCYPEVTNGNRKGRIGEHKRQISKNWRSPEITSPMRLSVLRRMISCTTDRGKVKESVAVVKKSNDPYEDFKRSMLEMILEKQIFEAKDLEELLQCFLSLNSRQYHGVIVEAFSEIWETLFCDSPVKNRKSIG